MKPDWKDAPEWAQWLAQDRNGWWFWYAQCPFLCEPLNIWIGGKSRAMNCAVAMCAVITDQCNWKDSLETRPQN